MAEEQQDAAAAAEATTQKAETPLRAQLIKKGKKVDTQGKRAIREYVAKAVEYAMQGSKVISGDMERTIKSWQAEIDRKISQQLSTIMHDEKFQRLEGTWRGLEYLVKNSETGTNLKIKVMNVTKKT